MFDIFDRLRSKRGIFCKNETASQIGDLVTLYWYMEIAGVIDALIWNKINYRVYIIVETNRTTCDIV